MRELDGKWEGISVLFEADHNSGYDWRYCALLTRKLSDGRREYASYAGSGCSCSWPFEMSPEWYGISWSTDLLAVERCLANEIRDIPEHYMPIEERVSSIAELRILVSRERGRYSG